MEWAYVGNKASHRRDVLGDRGGTTRSPCPKITLPYEPFIGTIGTSPEVEAISALQPDYYGGNMDLPDVGVDAVIYLPVNTKGALLYLGACHAAQGDGELCGVAIEHPTVTTVQVDLIKNWTIKWPRLETRDFIMTIGSSRPMEDAARIAYRELAGATTCSVSGCARCRVPQRGAEPTRQTFKGTRKTP